MSPDEVVKYHKNRAVTLGNMIKRYGVKDGAARYANYCEVQSYAGTSKEYFIDKYGKLAGISKYLEVNEKKALGSKKRTDMLPFSGISQQLFEKIATVESRYGENEWFIRDRETGCIYFADFTNLKTKKIIEFYGDYWHANPMKYLPDHVFDFDIHVNMAILSWYKKQRLLIYWLLYDFNGEFHGRISIE
jgi:hypothetical protein